MSAMRYLRDWWYLARANTGHALQEWQSDEEAPDRPTPLVPREVPEQGAEALEPATKGQASVAVTSQGKG